MRLGNADDQSAKLHHSALLKQEQHRLDERGFGLSLRHASSKSNALRPAVFWRIFHVASWILSFSLMK
jgi:hypothetical protein